MLSQNVIIGIVTVIIGIGIVFGTRFAGGLTDMNKEDFCNCTGMAARTAYPTYYTYRPFGDVSDYPQPLRGGDFVARGTPRRYGNNYLNRASNGEFIKIGAEIPPVNSFYNLGWKTGMPYDAFVASSGNNWAAGSDPYFKNHSSVPMLAVGCSEGNLRAKNGGYATNYGDSFNDELGPVNVPVSASQFVTGQYGFPNMLSNGQPELLGPAGSFSESAMPCGASQNAYNLAVGVL